MTRILHHLLSLGAALLLCFLCLFVSSWFAAALGEWCFYVLAVAAGVGWAVGGLTVGKKYPEAGPLLLCVGGGLLWWLLGGLRLFGSAMQLLFECQFAMLSAAGTSWLVLRGDRSAQRRTTGFALALVVVLSFIVLRTRVPGRACEMLDEDGIAELVAIAHPLTEDWKSAHGAHHISRSGDAIYVWRDSARAMRPGVNGERMYSAAPWSGQWYQLTKLVEPSEIGAAYEALWRTEEWLLSWEVARHDLPFFMPALAFLRAERRRGTVWRSEPVDG